MSDSGGPLTVLGIGAASAISAIFLFIRSKRFLATGVTVHGRVIDIAHSSGKSGTVYKPVIQFTSADGQTVTFTDSVGRGAMKYERGQTVKVMHAPGDPHSARIPGWFRMWFAPTFSALNAVIFLATGIGMYVAGDAQPQRVSASAVSEPAEGTVTMPGALPTDVVPSVPGSRGTSGFVVSDGSGLPRTVDLECVSIRDKKGGKVREVRLRFEGGELTLTASPYTGPGPYTPGTNLDVEGTLFGAQGQLTGVVVFDQSGKTGSVNLIAGSASATGTWGCT